MKIDQIETLIQVVDTGSISAASKNVNKSQPAVSMTIKRLEETVGIKLFNRNGYRLELTEKGHVYYQKCKLIVDQIKQLNSYSDSLKRGEEHEVVISIEDSANLGTLLSALKEVQNTFPDTQLKLNSESQLKSLSRLHNEEVHLAFTPWLPTFAAEGDFESKHVSNLEILFCVHRSLLTEAGITNEQEIDQGLLSRLPQIVPSDFAIDLNKDVLMRPIGRSLLKVNGYHACVAAIHARLGWGPMIKNLWSPELSKDFVCFQLEKGSSPICGEIRVVKNRKTILGPAANKIWSLF